MDSRTQTTESRRNQPLLLLLLAAALVLSCHGEASFDTPTSPSLSVISVEISGTTELTDATEVGRLTATATLSDGTSHDVTNTTIWASSNPEIAIVADGGLVTAIADGTATITATHAGASATHPLAVRRRRGVQRPRSSTPSPFSFLAGTWVGTWEDTRYGVSGSLEATFVVNGSNVTATGVIGLDSLGLGNETGTGTGTVSGDTLDFTFSADTVGNGSGSLSTGGAGSGGGTVTGVLNFGGFTYTGTVTPTEISGTFEFTSPSGGRGVASLTKQ